MELPGLVFITYYHHILSQQVYGILGTKAILTELMFVWIYGLISRTGCVGMLCTLYPTAAAQELKMDHN